MGVYSDVQCNYTHIAIIDTYLDCEVTTYAMVHSLSEVVTSYCLKYSKMITHMMVCSFSDIIFCEVITYAMIFSLPKNITFRCEYSTMDLVVQI